MLIGHLYKLTKKAPLQKQVLTSRGNVETTRRIFSNVDLAGMLRVNIRNRWILNVPDYNRIPVCVQESPAFWVSAQNQRRATLSSRQSRPSVFCRYANISSQLSPAKLPTQDIFASTYLHRMSHHGIVRKEKILTVRIRHIALIFFYINITLTMLKLSFIQYFSI